MTRESTKLFTYQKVNGTSGNPPKPLKTPDALTTWEPKNANEAEFERVMAAATQASTEDIRSAIALLIGTDPQVWRKAIHTTSNHLTAERTGAWADPPLPFSRGFLIPRHATRLLIRSLSDGYRLNLLQGTPLAAKCSVLRELFEATDANNDLTQVYKAITNRCAAVLLFRTERSLSTDCW